MIAAVEQRSPIGIAQQHHEREIARLQEQLRQKDILIGEMASDKSRLSAEVERIRSELNGIRSVFGTDFEFRDEWPELLETAINNELIKTNEEEFREELASLNGLDPNNDADWYPATIVCSVEINGESLQVKVRLRPRYDVIDVCS